MQRCAHGVGARSPKGRDQDVPPAVISAVAPAPPRPFRLLALQSRAGGGRARWCHAWAGTPYIKGSSSPSPPPPLSVALCAQLTRRCGRTAARQGRRRHRRSASARLRPHHGIARAILIGCRSARWLWRRHNDTRVGSLPPAACRRPWRGCVQPLPAPAAAEQAHAHITNPRQVRVA